MFHFDGRVKGRTIGYSNANIAIFTNGGPKEVMSVAGIPNPAMYAIRSCMNPTLRSSDIPREVNVQLPISLKPDLCFVGKKGHTRKSSKSQ
jgi:hypothetical protein